MTGMAAFRGLCYRKEVDRQGEIMARPQGTILIVDDEEWNRDILREYLGRAGYATLEAEDGHQALARVEADAPRLDAILLDRMMPGIDGMEVLRRLKANPEYKTLPVILQTARADPASMAEGIEAGAFYYLTKPFEPEVMLAVVRAAVLDRRQIRELNAEIQEQACAFGLAVAGTFEVRTVEEAYSLAAMLARTCPNPTAAAVGLAELMLNGIEHGNLGIGYDEKTQLFRNGTWEEEVRRRLDLPENAGKFVVVRYERRSDEVFFRVQDQGPGFDWARYLDFEPERATHCHGRGIALARVNAFTSLEYEGKGNSVVARVARRS